GERRLRNPRLGRSGIAHVPLARDLGERKQARGLVRDLLGPADSLERLVGPVELREDREPRLEPGVERVDAHLATPALEPLQVGETPPAHAIEYGVVALRARGLLRDPAHRRRSI